MPGLTVKELASGGSARRRCGAPPEPSMLLTCDGDGFYLIDLLNAIAAISLGFVEPEIGLMQYRVNTYLFGTIDHCHAHAQGYAPSLL
jgi:hypothetical protein